MKNILANIGRVILGFLNSTGAVCLFSFSAVINIVRRPLYIKPTVKQMIEIGYYSLPVVGLTAFCTGAVLAIQSYVGFSRFSAESAVATVVVLSITRELGPVLAGLMVAGRVGASIAAEIGTMRITEQIDALVTLSTNPIKYLVTPRVLAATLMMPCLVIVADIIGVLGGYIISVYNLGFSSDVYLQNTFQYLERIDVVSGLIKSSIFGFIIAIIGCYSGYTSQKGAQGVGNATTNAVVISSILILVSNYLLTKIFFS